MAENSLLWTTDGTGDGGTAGYTQTEMTNFFRSFTPTANRGVVMPDYLNELEITGSSSPVSYDTGGAIVYGFLYYNDASGTLAVPTPSTATRIDRIALRADWTAQTVRATRLAGTEGVGSAPVLTQTANTTWDIPLAQVSITTGGVITVTDEREFANVVGDGGVTTVKIADDAVTTAKINAGAVDTTELADGAVTTAKIADANITTAKIADSNVTTAKIADANVTTAKIADANVTLAKMGTASVETDQLVDAAVTDAKISYNTWAAVSIGTNFSSTNLRVKTLGDMAVFSGQVSATSIDTLIGTIPSGYRPPTSAQRYLMASESGAVKVVALTISHTTGAITLNTSPGTPFFVNFDGFGYET